MPYSREFFQGQNPADVARILFQGETPKQGEIRSVGGSTFAWDGREWQHGPNANDPQQQTQWAADKSGQIGDQATGRFNELTDLNSGYNTRVRDILQQLASGMTPTANMLFAVNRQAGNLSSASASQLAGEQSRAAQSRATAFAHKGWLTHLLGTESQAQGYLGLAGQMEGQKMQGYGQIWQQKEQKKMQENAMWQGIANSVLGLGGGLIGQALVGGGGGGVNAGYNPNEMFMGTAQSNPTPMQDAAYNFSAYPQPYDPTKG